MIGLEPVVDDELQWHLSDGDFVNAMESPIGFGSTFDEALKSLQRFAARLNNIDETIKDMR